MFPNFQVGPIDFPAYFTLLIVGYTLVVLLAHRDALRVGLNGNRFLDMAMILLLAGIVGSRILHVAVDGYWDEYVNLCVAPLETKGEMLPRQRACTDDAQCVAAKKGELCHPDKGTCHQGRDCLRAFKFWYGGLTYYGGLALAAIVAVWYMRRFRMPFWEVADLAGFAIPLGLVFGRMGCFLAGCCFGRPCDSHGCVAFPAHSPAWDQHVEQALITRSATDSLPVVPTQLWEAGSCLLIFAFAYFWLRKHRRFKGEVFLVAMALYSIARFIIEFWRDDSRGDWLGLATSQWLGLPLLAICGGFYVVLWRREREARSADRARQGVE